MLKRDFEIDLESGPNSGGQFKIIAAILELPVVERIHTHWGLRARAPPPDSVATATLGRHIGYGPATWIERTDCVRRGQHPVSGYEPNGFTRIFDCFQFKLRARPSRYEYMSPERPYSRNSSLIWVSGNLTLLAVR